MDKEQGQFQKEHLTIRYDTDTLESGDKSVTITFEGRFDMKYPSLDVMPYLMEIKDKIPTEQISNMNIDFNDLDYMNSAGIRTILMWMYKFIQDREDKSLPITILYSEEKAWQKSITPTFNDFKPDTIKLKPV
jgi:hypothetical protein